MIKKPNKLKKKSENDKFQTSKTTKLFSMHMMDMMMTSGEKNGCDDQEINHVSLSPSDKGTIRLRLWLRWLPSSIRVAQDNAFVCPLIYLLLVNMWSYHIFNFSGWKSGKTRTPLKNVPCSDLSLSFWELQLVNGV